MAGTETELQWQLRVSPRARYAKLQIKPYGGLEVVIPPRFPRAEIPFLVAKHSAWLRRQLERQAELRQAVRLPQQLRLAFDSEPVPVVYKTAGQQRSPARQIDPLSAPLVIDAVDQQGQIRQLRDFIRAKARAQLPPRLAELSQQTGLTFNRVSIRSQKTRWGSCSSRAHISLNDQLLFQTAATVDYLIIHELCHTHHLNHSRAFWQLVAYHCPQYKIHENLLSHSRNSVPDWFLLDLYR